MEASLMAMWHRFVEVKWDGSNWTNVSSDVRGLSVDTCRKQGTGVTWAPGSASIVLDNRARDYDPLYSSGPYYGDLDVGKEVMVKIGLTSNIVAAVVLWHGWIDEFTPAYHEMAKDATMTLRCVDALGRAASATIPAGVTPGIALGDTTYERANALSEAAGDPVVVQDGSGVGDPPVARFGDQWDATKSHNLLDELTLLAQLENGPLLTDDADSSELRLYSRYWFVNISTSATSYTTVGNTSVRGISDIRPAYGALGLITSASATSDAGDYESAENATAVTAYGQRDSGLRLRDLPAEDNSGLAGCVASWVGLNDAPTWRIESLTLRPQRGDNSLWTSIANVKLLFRITVVFDPTGPGSAVTADYFVTGMSHRSSATEWETSWHLTPCAAYDALGFDAMWIWDDATLGEFDGANAGVFGF